MMLDHIMTGQIVFPDRGWVTVIFFFCFFFVFLKTKGKRNCVCELNGWIDLSFNSVLFLKKSEYL